MAERSCSNCHFSRRLGPDINCWESPPRPLFLGINPTTNQRVIVPMMTPTWPDYRCRRYESMQPGHPDYRDPDFAEVEPPPAATHQGSKHKQ